MTVLVRRGIFIALMGRHNCGKILLTGELGVAGF